MSARPCREEASNARVQALLNKAGADDAARAAAAADAAAGRAAAHLDKQAAAYTRPLFGSM
jgi:predicted RNA binding protein with dsRBD fold (UPF0201 family)